MTTDILEAIQSRLSDDVVSKFATSTGEPPSRVRTAMSSGAFVTVAGLIRRGSTTEGAAAILSHLEERSPGGLRLLGERKDDLSGIISDSSGVSRTSATGILSMLTPIAAVVLDKEVLARNLDAAGLSAFLIGQKDSVLGHPGAPAGIAAVLAPDARVTPGTATTTYISTRTKTPWLAMLAGTVVAAILLVVVFTLMSPKVIQSTATGPAVHGPVVGAPAVSGQTTITSGEVSKPNAGPKAALDAGP